MTASIRLWDFIDYQGLPWQVVNVDGPNLTLRNQFNAREQDFPIVDVLGDDSYAPREPDTLPVFTDLRLFETLTETQAKRARALYEHVLEVLTGLKPGQEPPGNPEYDPSVPIGQRMDAKAAELTAAGFTPHTRRALQRYVARFKAEGIAAFVDKRATRVSKPAGRSDPALLEIMRKEVAKQDVLSTGTRSRVLVNTVIQARQDGIAVPSRTTLYRMLARVESDRAPFGLATTRRTQGNRPVRTWSQRQPVRPGELVEIDSNTLDLLVRYADGSTGRPEVTLMIDVATRSIMSAMVVPNSTKDVDAALVLVRALAPLHHQPGWDDSLRLSRSFLPAHVIAPDEEVRAVSAARPVIIPENITVDRGMVFLSEVFTEACRQIGASITTAAPYSPTVKPHVERVFNTINKGFTQYLAGYTGHGVHMRHKDVDQDAALPIQVVQDALDYWIVAHYQNRPHEGLVHPAMPKKRLTPNEAYAAAVAIAPPVHVTLSQDDLIGFYKGEWRQVRPDGVHLDSIRYDSEELDPLRGRNSGLTGAANGRWQVRYNPTNLTAVWVRDHENHRWIKAPMVLADRLQGPFTADMARLAVEAARKSDPTRRDPLQVDIVQELTRMTSGDTRTPRERAAVRRVEDGGNDALLTNLLGRAQNPGLTAVPHPSEPPTEAADEHEDTTPAPRRRAVLPPEQF